VSGAIACQGTFTVFGDIFVVTTGGWEVVMTSRPQGSEEGLQHTEHRPAPLLTSIL
jgi:hypothetical protein